MAAAPPRSLGNKIFVGIQRTVQVMLGGGLLFGGVSLFLGVKRFMNRHGIEPDMQSEYTALFLYAEMFYHKRVNEAVDAFVAMEKREPGLIQTYSGYNDWMFIYQEALEPPIGTSKTLEISEADALDIIGFQGKPSYAALRKHCRQKQMEHHPDKLSALQKQIAAKYPANPSDEQQAAMQKELGMINDKFTKILTLCRQLQNKYFKANKKAEPGVGKAAAGKRASTTQVSTSPALPIDYFPTIVITPVAIVQALSARPKGKGET